MAYRKLLPFAAFATVALGSLPALAAKPFTAGKNQIVAHVTGGLNLGDAGANPYGFGLGIRSGSTVGPGVYLGGNFDWHFGEEYAEGATANAWAVTSEIGFDIALGELPLVIRPQVGLGYHELRNCVEGVIISGCSGLGSFTVQPGLYVPFHLGPLMLTPGARANLPTESVQSDVFGLFFEANVGLVF